MPTERLSMRHIREVLRLHYSVGMAQRAVARSLGLAQGTVSKYLNRTRRAGLTWPLPPELDDDDRLRLYPPPSDRPSDERPQPDWALVHRELRRPNVTLMLLWEEYCDANSECFSYSWFCERYKEWAGRLKPTLRQIHVAGEKLFVDYSGHTMEVIDGLTGEVRSAQIFVAVLGASNYLRRSQPEPKPAGLDRLTRSGICLFRRRGPTDGERQSEGRHYPGLLSRTDGQPDLCRSRSPLPHRYRSGAAVSAKGQSQGRSRGPNRRAMDSGALAQPPLLLTRLP